MTKRQIQIDPWPQQPAKDAREAVAIYADIICALEHVTPSLNLFADDRVQDFRRETARIETDNLAYELRRARSLLVKHHPDTYLNEQGLRHDIESALKWSGIENLARGEARAIGMLKAIQELLYPHYEFHGMGGDQ